MTHRRHKNRSERVERKSSAQGRLPREYPVALSALLALEALIATIVVVREPSEQTILLGLSYAKLGLAGVLLLFAAAGAAFAIALYRRAGFWSAVMAWLSIEGRRQLCTWIIVAIGAIGWAGLFIPAYRAGAIGGYLEGLRPLSVLLVLSSFECLAFLYVERTKPSVREIRRAARRGGPDLLRLGMIVFVMISIWAIIAATRLGIDARSEDYWYEAGVPLLATQALGAVALGSAVALIDARQKNPDNSPKTDLWIFAAIWLLSGVIWMLTPIPSGYFNPGPYLPNNETYPYSDAAEFDTQSQFALIGQGLGDGRGLGRPAYPVFLVLVHVLTGQDYARNMQLQAALYGIFPALIYLIGRALLGRAAGVAAAAAAVMRGWGAITATAIINVANSKQMLTDFPTAIGIALVVLGCILWFKSIADVRLPLLVGGALAITVYLRPTAVAILPVILLVTLARYRHVTRSWAVAVLAILLAGYIIFAAPWEMRDQVIAGGGYYPSSLRKILTTLHYRLFDPDPEEEVIAEGDAPGELPADSLEPENDGRAQDSAGEPVDSPAGLATGLIADHFFHNIVTSFLSLPDSLTFHDLRTTLRAENSYWRITWTGMLTPGQILVLSLNLVIAAIGLWTACRKHPEAGLLPAGIFVSYQLANAFARTSGGRYIVPVDWVVTLYFTAGLLQCALWCLSSLGLLTRRIAEPAMEPPHRPFDLRSLSGLTRPAILLLIAGALLVVPDFIFPAHFEISSTKQVAALLESYGPDRIGATNAAFITELLREQGRAYVGKIMYPRAAPRDASGEMFFLRTGQIVDYPVLAFTLIGPAGSRNMRLSGNLPDGPPNYSDAIVIGCRDEQRHLEVAVIIVSTPVLHVYSRDPLPPAKCPLPKPVCDNNGNCR